MLAKFYVGYLKKILSMSILTMIEFSSTFLNILSVSYFSTLSINSIIFVTSGSVSGS